MNGLVVYNTHSNDKVEKISKLALDKISQHNLPLLPAIYEVWYVYYSEVNPELSHAIDLIEIDGEQDIDRNHCLKIYEQFLSQNDQVENVKEAGNQVQTTLSNVNNLVQDVKTSTTEYNDTLSALNTELNQNDCTPEQVKGLVQHIVKDTNTILEKNKRLEEELNKQASLMGHLQRDIDRIRQEALTDGLTNVANRKAFDQQVFKLITNCAKDPNMTFSLILVDIDHFKSFNDNYGHQIGDQVLRLVARTLIDGIKGRDFVARYGGEEFAILLPDTNQHSAHKVADELRKAVAHKQIVNKNTGKKMGRITLSGGVTEYFSGDDVEDIVKRADTGLYDAKGSGRNRICMAKVQLARE